jgi:hypothetical protein
MHNGVDMAVVNQKIAIDRGQDFAIEAVGDDATNPSTWTLLFTLVSYRGNTTAAFSTSGVAVSGPNEDGSYTLIVTMTRAQTLLLLRPEYYWDFWRTDTGSNIPLASGTMVVNTPSRLSA